MEAALTVPHVGSAGSDGQSEVRRWRSRLAPYARPHSTRALGCLATSLVPYLALMLVMYLLLSVSYLLVLVVAIPASGFLLRTFIVFHDCAHSSFFPSRRLNEWIGVIVGLFVYSPFHSWRHEHAMHHATSGDLDRRGVGDVETWTVAEYRSKPVLSRTGYRLFRNPLVMFTIGPIWALALEPRLIPLKARRRIQRSHLFTDIALGGIVAALCLTIGWRDFLLLQTPVVIGAGTAGVWLFYVQHQFEGVYWRRTEEWSYLDAALAGSSHLKLHPVLRFFTGSIGLHHVHHLSACIPNYNLQRAHDENPELHCAPTLSIWDGLRAVRLKLYDESDGRLVTFGQARRAARTGC